MGLAFEYIVNEGQEQEFTFEGQVYVAYVREYNTGDFDVEVNFKDDEATDVEERVYEYAWQLFESLGLI